MRRFTQKMWDLLCNRKSQKARPRPASRRLALESLEDRAVPTTANASGTITGVAFVDGSHNGIFNTSDYLLPGVTVDLSGKTSQQGKAVNLTATTDAKGAFTFNFVQPGTYKIGFEGKGLVLGEPTVYPALTGPAGVTEVAQVTIAGGQTLTRNVAVAGLAPAAVSLGDFSSSGGTNILKALPAGSGVANASSRANNAPTVVTSASTTVAGAQGGSNVVNLAANFTDPDFTDSEIQINTNAGPIKVQLFDKTAPLTVANFFDYILNGSYNNLIFHRLVSDFVIQTGYDNLVTSGGTTTLKQVSTLPDVENEFGASNTAGTLAMAKLGSNPNSASSQWFISLADNASNLDSQNGGFTVFGKIVGQTSTSTVSNPAVTKLAAATIDNESSFDPTLNTIPLKNYKGTNFPTDATASNFDLIKNIQILSRNESLTYKVLSNSNPDLVTPNLQDNYLTLDYAQNMTGTASIKVEAIDQFGATVTTTLTVNVSNKPVVTGVLVTPDSTTSATTLKATPSSTDPFAGKTVTYTYQWLHNGAAIPGATNSSLSLTGLAIGANDTISVQVTPNDGTNTGDVFTSTKLTFATLNPITLNMPSVTGVSIAPDSLTAPTTLTATPTAATDPYGKTVTYTYQWLHNGTAISGATSATLTLSSAGTIAAGDSFSVEVTPSDGVTNGVQFTSQTVTINTTSPNTLNLPKVTGVAITPDSTTKTTTLTASVPSGDSSDPYSRSLTYTYQWEQDGKVIASTVASATTATLVLSQLTVHKGDTFSVMVTPNDGTISGAAFTSHAVTLATIKPDTLKLPVVDSVTIGLDSTTAPTTLTAKTTSTDPYAGPVTLTYQWLQNGTAIAGATSQSLTLTSVPSISKGDSFTVQVTPADGVTGATFTSKALTVATINPVEFELPVVSKVTVTPNKITGTTTLTATATSSDPYGRTVTYTYQWDQNGRAIPGATSQILKLTSVTAKKGDDFTVQVTPSDGTVTGAELTSGDVAVISTTPITIGVPVVDGVTISPDNVSGITTLTATPTGHDPSGNNTVTYSYQWLLNGKPIAGATSDTLNLTTQIPGGVKVGSSLTVQVTPNDGTLVGNVFTSKPVTIATTSPITLTGPIVTSVAFSADSLTATTKLTATPTSTDSSATFAYQWLQNGIPISGATTSSLDLTKLNVSVGDSFSLRIVPSDGTQTGLTFTSKALTVATANPITFHLPAVTSVVITPDDATDMNVTTLTATVPANGSTDPYGNTVTYTYQWLLDGKTITGATSQMLTLATAGTFKAGDTFSVIVTPNDGLISGDPFTSHTVSVATVSPTTLSGPVVTSVLVSENGTTLTATPASTDPNGETVNYSYQWLQNGTAISGATGKTFDLTTLATVKVGDSLTVQVTPTDASVPGAVFTSSPVTVATTSPASINLPVVTAVVITPDSPNSTTVLTAVPTSTDPYNQSNSNTYTYQWLHNGIAIAGATSATLNLSTQVSSVNAGDTFSVKVTPSDGVATGAVFTSHTVMIATASPITLSGPVVTSVLINTDNTTATTMLTATPASTDPNGETVTYSYQWLQNGTPIGGATGKTLTLNGTNINPSDAFTVQVTPADATIKGKAFTSSQLTVQSISPTVFELPRVASVVITPDSATNAMKLTAVPSGTDPYGRALSYTYQWQQNGMPISGATSQTLDLTTLTVNANDVFTVVVTANDGTVIGAAFTSGNVEATSSSPIAIGLPVVDSVAVNSNDSTNMNVTTLTAVPTSHDPSGNSTITYTYQWLQNGVAIDGATSATLNLTTQVTGGIAVGDKFTVEVTPKDGTLTGDVFTSNAATIATVNPITLAS